MAPDKSHVAARLVKAIAARKVAGCVKLEQGTSRGRDSLVGIEPLHGSMCVRTKWVENRSARWLCMRRVLARIQGF